MGERRGLLASFLAQSARRPRGSSCLRPRRPA